MPNNFTYNNNVPNPPDNPSVDVPDMQTNSMSIESIIGVDHVTFNTNGGGIHKQVTLANEAAPGLGDGNGVLYGNVGPSNSWPFWQNSLQSFQVIGGNSANLPRFATNTNYQASSGTIPSTNGGWSYLPGGMMIQYGIATSTHFDTRIDFVFPTPFISFVGSVCLTAQRSNTND